MKSNFSSRTFSILNKISFLVFFVLLVTVFIYGSIVSKKVGLKPVRQLVNNKNIKLQFKYGEPVAFFADIRYSSWLKGNAGMLTITDAETTPSIIKSLIVSDSEISPQNAFLIAVNLDSDEDIEFFAHQPDTPHRSRVLAMQPSNKIIDYQDDSFNVKQIGILKTFLKTGLYKWIIMYFIIIVMFCSPYILMIIEKPENKKTWGILILIIVLGCIFYFFAQVVSFLLYALSPLSNI